MSATKFAPYRIVTPLDVSPSSTLILEDTVKIEDKRVPECTTTTQFHKLFYNSKVWAGGVNWRGVPILKCPFDLWIYQEIISWNTPDVIVECGSGMLGSAIFMADICRLVGRGKVITIDLREYELDPPRDDIIIINGGSTALNTYCRVKEMCKGLETMVVLDSDHRKEHVTAELELYKSVVSVGQHMIVEDGHVNGNPVEETHGAGPAEALGEFLVENDNFVVDEGCEKFGVTFNPGGYLMRKS